MTPNGTRRLRRGRSDENAIKRIDLATNAVGPAIPIGGVPQQIAITPDSALAYAFGGDDPVTPVDLATGTPGTPIPLENHFHRGHRDNPGRQPRLAHRRSPVRRRQARLDRDPGQHARVARSPTWNGRTRSRSSPTSLRAPPSRPPPRRSCAATRSTSTPADRATPTATSPATSGTSATAATRWSAGRRRTTPTPSAAPTR